VSSCLHRILFLRIPNSHNLSPLVDTQTHSHTHHTHTHAPGTYHTYPGSKAIREKGAFTLKQFLDANAREDQQVFLGGVMSYADPALSAAYEMVPVGLVSRFVPVRGGRWCLGV
jgi:hypothetical protein